LSNKDSTPQHGDMADHSTQQQGQQHFLRQQRHVATWQSLN